MTKNINEEPPQDRVTVRGPGHPLPPAAANVTDWEWELEERYGPNEEPSLPWFDRQ